MVIFKKALPRRTFLRGMGSVVALPLLDAMLPALSAAPQSPVRLGVIYVPNGMWPMDKWTPKTDGANFELMPSMEPIGKFKDQLAAAQLGKETQLSSLEVSLFMKDLVGSCEGNNACVYTNTPCWRTPTTPLPMEHNPRALFERLFGDSDTTDGKSRLERIK